MTTPSGTHLGDPVLTLPFMLRGHSGTVRVSYAANQDPRHWGFNLIEVPFPLDRVRGFPIIQAEIDYADAGYAALMGWIQVVTVENREPVDTLIEPDVYPIHWHLDTPFVTFGQAPTLFDAPGPNPPRANERWTAYTALATAGGGARRREVTPVLGVLWGYELDAGHATPIPPRIADAGDWRRAVTTLTEYYPNWTFRE